MRKNFGAQTWVYPMPVLIVGTYDENGVPNAMNAAWGGVYDTNQIMLCLSHDHKTTENIKKTGAFTVSFATEDTMIACDYVGVTSAYDVPNKFEKAGFHATKSSRVNAPLIDELPMAFECRVKSFKNERLVGEIVNIVVDESIITDGKIDPKKMKPIVYDSANHKYYSLGEVVGNAHKDGHNIK